MFCRQCLTDYFKDDAVKSCPNCRQQGLRHDGVKISKSIKRLVNSLRVRCDLLQEKDDEVLPLLCKWEGDLSNLDEHKIKDCPLFVIQCAHCQVEYKRYQMKAHAQNCPDMELLCELNCS